MCIYGRATFPGSLYSLVEIFFDESQRRFSLTIMVWKKFNYKSSTMKIKEQQVLICSELTNKDT